MKIIVCDFGIMYNLIIVIIGIIMVYIYPYITCLQFKSQHNNIWLGISKFREVCDIYTYISGFQCCVINYRDIVVILLDSNHD